MTETPSDVIREKFAKRLEYEIASRGWNQSDLAREASKHHPNGEIARDNISNYCLAKALPGPSFLLAIAKALQTTPEDLLPERGITIPRNVGALPSTDVRDAGDGMAFLRINKRLPWQVAVEILGVLNEHRKAELREQGYDAETDNGRVGGSGRFVHKDDPTLDS